MLIDGVLKFFIALSLLSSYKMWVFGYEHDSSTAWSLFVSPPNSDGQDDSDTWLNGYSPQPPVYDQDSLDKWLYGPLLTQMPTDYPFKSDFRSSGPTSYSAHREPSRSSHPDFEVHDSRHKVVTGSDSDYVIRSGSEGNVFMGH